MLASKHKELFVEAGTFSLLSATASSSSSPLIIEQLFETPMQADWSAFEGHVENLIGGKGQRFVSSRCGIYPESRFFRRFSIESAAKAKEPNFFPTVLAEQMRIDLNTHLATVVNASSGSQFDVGKPLANQKEVLIAGLGTADRQAAQDRLVQAGIYPASLQLGTLSTIGALMHYMRFRQLERPTLLLELTPGDANLFILSGQQVDVARPIPYGLNSMFPLIQKELGLRDEASAKKLFFSNTFDFTEMGGTLLRKMLKELQASTGFYEVQTGKTIGQIFVSLLPKNLSWIETVLSRSLGVPLLRVDCEPWLESAGIRGGSEVQLANLDNRWFGLLSLMLNHEEAGHATA
ncbi:MAG: hypothetical protein ACLFR7_01705 [Opitutales bacterium]